MALPMRVPPQIPPRVAPDATDAAPTPCLDRRASAPAVASPTRLSDEDKDRLVRIIQDPASTSEQREDAETQMLRAQHGWIERYALSVWRRLNQGQPEPTGDERHDLIVEAQRGYLHGLRKLDRTKGRARNTGHAIERFVGPQYIRKYASEHLSRVVYGVPQKVALKRARMLAIEGELVAANGGAAVSDEDIAREMRARGLRKTRHSLEGTVAAVKALRAARREIPFSELEARTAHGPSDAAEAEPRVFWDQSTEDEDDTEPEDTRLTRAGVVEAMRQRVRSLPDPRERLVVGLVTGIPLHAEATFDQEPMTYPEIARLLDLTPAEVKAIHTDVVARWRAAVA